MNDSHFTCLKIKRDRGVAFIIMDCPPMNVIGAELVMDLDRLSQEILDEDDIKVLVFESADPDFFIAHGDVELILGMGNEAPPKSTTGGLILGSIHGLLDRFRTMPKVTIAKIEGAARGGGSEFALAMDMRFAALGKAVFGQPEVSLGIIPGAGGSQRLPRLIGTARAMEVILGCGDIPAELAEQYGYINRAMDPDKLGPYVASLAYRIASYPSEAIAAAKEAIYYATELPISEGFIEEENLCNPLMVTDETKRRVKKFLEFGGQDRAGEEDFQKIIEALE